MNPQSWRNSQLVWMLPDKKGTSKGYEDATTKSNIYEASYWSFLNREKMSFLFKLEVFSKQHLPAPPSPKQVEKYRKQRGREKQAFTFCMDALYLHTAKDPWWVTAWNDKRPSGYLLTGCFITTVYITRSKLWIKHYFLYLTKKWKFTESTFNCRSIYGLWSAGPQSLYFPLRTLIPFVICLQG